MLRSLVTLLACALALSSCAEPARQAASAPETTGATAQPMSQQQRVPTYDEAVDAADAVSNPCSQGASGDRCRGRPGKEWAQRDDATKKDARKHIATALMTLSTNLGDPKPSEFRERAADGGTTQRLAITAVDAARRMRIRDFDADAEGARGIVVARIRAKMGSGWKRDLQFGAGPQAAGDWDEDFFLIVVDRKNTDQTLQPDASYIVGKWQLWGLKRVKGYNEAHRVDGKTLDRPFRLCARAHPLDDVGNVAQFIPCKTAHLLQEALAADSVLRKAVGHRALAAAVSEDSGLPLADTSGVQPTTKVRREALIDAALAGFVKVHSLAYLTAAQRTLLRSALGDADAPGWMPCGLGCCVAGDQ